LATFCRVTIRIFTGVVRGAIDEVVDVTVATFTGFKGAKVPILITEFTIHELGAVGAGPRYWVAISGCAGIVVSGAFFSLTFDTDTVTALVIGGAHTVVSITASLLG